jgi:hypothetical protein
MIFLTPSELKALTGKCHRTLQIAELNRMKIKFSLPSDGRPRVLRAAVESMHKHDTNAPSGEPDFTYFEVA